MLFRSVFRVTRSRKCLGRQGGVRPDSRSGLTQMGGFPRLESGDRDGFVDSSCLCGCGWFERVCPHWCTPVGSNLFAKPWRPRLWTCLVRCWLTRIRQLTPNCNNLTSNRTIVTITRLHLNQLCELSCLPLG